MVGTMDEGAQFFFGDCEEWVCMCFGGGPHNLRQTCDKIGVSKRSRATGVGWLADVSS